MTQAVFLILPVTIKKSELYEKKYKNNVGVYYIADVDFKFSEYCKCKNNI